MGRIRNVIFDLGGVMINYNPKEFIDSMGYDPQKSRDLCNAIFLDPVWQDMDLGIYKTYTEALEVFVQRHPELEKEIRHFFEPGWMDVYTVLEDTERILYDWVYEQGLDIYILSNYAADGFNHVKDKFGFFRKMKGYVVSAFEGCVKPQARMYTTLLERYGLKAEECVFIDDMERNIRAAEELGIRGILFTDPTSVKAQLGKMI